MLTALYLNHNLPHKCIVYTCTLYRLLLLLLRQTKHLAEQYCVDFFKYDTPKIVLIRSKKIGLLSRSVQACVVDYVVGYVMVYQKVVSAVTAKVKGNSLTTFTHDELDNVRPEWRYLYIRVWDVTDFVVQPIENKVEVISDFWRCSIPTLM